MQDKDTDERRSAEDELEALLLAGLNSDESEMTEDDWQTIRQEAQVEMQARASAQPKPTGNR